MNRARAIAAGWLLAGWVVAGAGCGDRVLKAAGEGCTASSECAAGLLCDFGQSPPVCAGNSTVADAAGPGPDAPRLPDADPAAPDAAPVPDAQVVPDAAVPDAALPDAALPDAAP